MGVSWINGAVHGDSGPGALLDPAEGEAMQRVNEGSGA